MQNQRPHAPSGGSWRVGAVASLGLAACSSGGGGFDTPAATQAPAAGPVTLKFMITSNGPADVKLQQDTVKAWETKTGNKVEVVAASDINQQLTQGFAAGSPPDVFFTDANVFPTYAKAGNMVAYGDQVTAKSDFYPNLVKTFTYDNKFYCAPKDFSTLALIINTEMWTKAGLTDADVPKTWADLETVATKLNVDGHKGLVIGDTRDRIGAFMKQAGGWIVNGDQTKMTADSAENLAALQEVQKLLSSGTTAFPKAVDAGWSGEAIGKNKTAMAIEGNWIKGAVKTDYPNLKWKAVELPPAPPARGPCRSPSATASRRRARTRPPPSTSSTTCRRPTRPSPWPRASASCPPCSRRRPATSRRSPTRRPSSPGRLRAGPGHGGRDGPGAEGLRQPARRPAGRRPQGAAPAPAEERRGVLVAPKGWARGADRAARPGTLAPLDLPPAVRTTLAPSSRPRRAPP